MKLTTAIIALSMITGMFSTACGSSACDDLKTEVETCCSDAGIDCSSYTSAYDDAEDDACQAVLDAGYSCAL